MVHEVLSIELPCSGVVLTVRNGQKLISLIYPFISQLRGILLNDTSLTKFVAPVCVRQQRCSRNDRGAAHSGVVIFALNLRTVATLVDLGSN